MFHYNKNDDSIFGTCDVILDKIVANNISLSELKVYNHGMLCLDDYFKILSCYCDNEFIRNIVQKYFEINEFIYVPTMLNLSPSVSFEQHEIISTDE